jgi:putative oxidoreductase
VGLPALATHLTIVVEAVGGLMLVAGYRTRYAALAVLPVLLGATWVHWKNGWLFTNAGGGWEYPLFLAAATVAQALIGDGAHAAGARVAGTEVARWQVATRS